MPFIVIVPGRPRLGLFGKFTAFGSPTFLFIFATSEFILFWIPAIL